LPRPPASPRSAAQRLPRGVRAQAKSTGELSIITFAANFLGGLARIFTSLQEGGGFPMARAYAIGAPPRLRLSADCTLQAPSVAAGRAAQTAA
jgi:hypothetical protein